MIIRSNRVLTEHGLRPADVHIDGSVISAVTAHTDAQPDVDAGDDIVMPGLIDTHLHVNEPGRTHWEGFETATRAAAAGGITTIYDMPLNAIPATTTLSALHAKREAALRSATVHVGFIGGVVPGNVSDLEPLSRDGIRLFKCFLVPSGVEEFPGVTEADLRVAMPELTRLDATLMVHAELPEYIQIAQGGDPRSYANYLATRPPSAELEAIAMIIRLAERYGTRVHIVHVSAPGSLPQISAARARGVRITCETCPHYLYFSAEEIPDGATMFKCAPPIRNEARRNTLWHAVMGGEVDMIVSDHSPCPPELKALESGNFLEAWGGIASLQLGLSAVWTEGRAHGLTVELLHEKMSAAPARLARIDDRKAKLAAGYDADVVIWNPEQTFVVDAERLYHRHPITPYHGRTLAGVVRATYLDGRLITTND